ncbi:MAG: DUF4168 domain-containing protein [Cyanobacteria bacterium J06643_4]
MILKKKVRSSSGWIALALSSLVFTQLAWFIVSPRILPAHAQTITDDDVANYAHAAFDIEQIRLDARDAASDILASEENAVDILEVSLSCQSARLKDMPDISRAGRVDLQSVLVSFCAQAKAIAEENDLTPKRFNSITAEHREDAALADRIKAAIKEL